MTGGIPQRIAFAGAGFDPLDGAQALAWIVARSAADRFAYVVTPNADHVVRLADNPEWSELQAAYGKATLSLCDSRVLALLARIRGLELPVVPGSDLTARLAGEAMPAGRSVLIVGGDDSARETLAARMPHAEVRQFQPPMGLLRDEAAMAECIARIVRERADFVLLAVGSPQQELIAHRIAECGDAGGTALCIGASVDFLTGKARRAPRWMQRLALEWLHRLLSEPRRMWRRYLVEGPRVFAIALRR